ncbi:translesion DNA synthesis-associated protein ImuA [Pseudoduganella sp. RAF53_2]|jgi:protein ImuA|uniref:translesion DNA synthesis-associated protein ImuA n=1 Tax=unclassified Pseudoduganella TaxID=2637179 RepID=UPI003F9DA48D
MARSDPIKAPEALHPSLWFASQLAQSTTRCVDTGYAALSAQLPGGGWPTGTLIELLLQQNGIGEMRLLHPALAGLTRPIVMLQPPQVPQVLGLSALGLQPSQLVWVKNTGRAADGQWAAEQALRSGCCGAVLLWDKHVRGESLRRLHMAAQSSDTLFCMMRPIQEAQDSSPAPLRLAVRGASGGVQIDFIKRRGPRRDEPLFLPLMPSTLLRHAFMDQPASTPASAGDILPAVVG